MPIDIDEFERADDDFFRGSSGSKEDQVLEYLAFNPKKAYSRREIQSDLEVSTMELLFTLSRLERKGLVRHKGEYWSVANEIESPEDISDEYPTGRGR